MPHRVTSDSIQFYADAFRKYGYEASAYADRIEAMAAFATRLPVICAPGVQYESARLTRRQIATAVLVELEFPFARYEY